MVCKKLRLGKHALQPGRDVAHLARARGVVQARVRVERDVLDACGLEHLARANGPRIASARIGVAVADEQRDASRLGRERELGLARDEGRQHHDATQRLLDLETREVRHRSAL